MIYKAFKDSNGKSMILVVGLGYYVPVMELENKKEEIADLKTETNKLKKRDKRLTALVKHYEEEARGNR